MRWRKTMIALAQTIVNVVAGNGLASAVTACREGEFGLQVRV